MIRQRRDLLHRLVLFLRKLRWSLVVADLESITGHNCCNRRGREVKNMHLGLVGDSPPVFIWCPRIV